MTREKTGKSLELGIKILHPAFMILRDNGGRLSVPELNAKIEQQVELDDWDKGTYRKSPQIRWINLLRLLSINCEKMGLLKREKNEFWFWTLTPEGEDSIKLGPEQLFYKVYRFPRVTRIDSI